MNKKLALAIAFTLTSAMSIGVMAAPSSVRESQALLATAATMEPIYLT